MIVNKTLDDDEVDDILRQARACLAGDWDAAPDAVKRAPQLKVHTTVGRPARSRRKPPDLHSM